MHYVLIINAAVSFIMGCALVLVWRRDRSQVFTLYIGWANLFQLLVPLIYWAKVRGNPSGEVIGNCVLAVVAGGYSTLLLVGAAHLANRPLERKSVWLIVVVLSVIVLTAVGLGGPRVGQASMGTINTVLGVVCSYWLWSASSARFSSEKLVGPLLVMLGLIQFIYVAYQDAGAELLATLGSLLRIILGLVLLYAALDRGALTARRDAAPADRRDRPGAGRRGGGRGRAGGPPCRGAVSPQLGLCSPGIRNTHHAKPARH